MLVAYGSGWFDSLKEFADHFLDEAESYQPIPENVASYQRLFELYQTIYQQTKTLNKDLMAFR